jgi:hypothetical protein
MDKVYSVPSVLKSIKLYDDSKKAMFHPLASKMLRGNELIVSDHNPKNIMKNLMINISDDSTKPKFYTPYMLSNSNGNEFCSNYHRFKLLSRKKNIPDEMLNYWEQRIDDVEEIDSKKVPYKLFIVGKPYQRKHYDKSTHDLQMKQCVFIDQEETNLFMIDFESGKCYKINLPYKEKEYELD